MYTIFFYSCQTATTPSGKYKNLAVAPMKLVDGVMPPLCGFDVADLLLRDLRKVAFVVFMCVGGRGRSYVICHYIYMYMIYYAR